MQIISESGQDRLELSSELKISFSGNGRTQLNLMRRYRADIKKYGKINSDISNFVVHSRQFI